MKRFSAFLLALILVCISVPFIGASAAEQKQLWITHYNESAAEGAGVVCTTANPNHAWRINVAFAPVEGKENTFTVVKIVDCLTSAEVTARVPLPTGGFIYQVNKGNDYAAINGGTDYTNDGADAMIAAISTWSVGDVFVINGLDLENKTIPTTTPDVKWYEDAYVCTATYADYDENAAVSDTTTEDPAESSDAETTPAESDVDDDNGGISLETILWIVASVVVIAVVAVVIVLVLKKK